MLHTCAARFDVTGNLEKFWVFWVNYTRPAKSNSCLLQNFLDPKPTKWAKAVL